MYGQLCSVTAILMKYDTDITFFPFLQNFKLCSKSHFIIHFQWNTGHHISFATFTTFSFFYYIFIFLRRGSFFKNIDQRGLLYTSWFTLSLHYTPNLGFWLELDIQRTYTSWGLWWIDKEGLQLSSSVFQKNDKAKKGFQEKFTLSQGWP